MIKKHQFLDARFTPEYTQQVLEKLPTTEFLSRRDIEFAGIMTRPHIPKHIPEYRCGTIAIYKREDVVAWVLKMAAKHDQKEPPENQV